MQNTSMKRALLCAVLAFAFGAQAQDNTKQQAQAKKSGDQKVDISDLENKYWAPKDTDFSVVQNRTYAKAGHWFVTPQIGLIVNDSYSKGPIYGMTANYFWTERHGLQLSYQHADLGDQDTVSSFHNISTGVTPNYNRMQDFVGIGYSWVPFYAKMSLLGTRVMYFDMAITPIVGMTRYAQQEISSGPDGGNVSKWAPSYGVDITQYFFINRWFAVRLDLNNHWTSESKISWGNDAVNGHTPGQNLGNYLNLDTTFTVGATFYF